MSYSEFLEQRAEDLQRIARGTQGEMSLDDVKQEAWLIATELCQKREKEFDFLDVDEQEELLRRLYNRCVRHKETKLRKAISIHRYEDDDDRGKLPHEPISPRGNPLDQLIAAEEANQRDPHKYFGYSQASAYVFLIVRFGGVPRLAEYLATSGSAVRQRFSRARENARLQPSLFDLTERLDPDFDPRPGFRYPPLRKTERNVRQLRLRLHRRSNFVHLVSSLYAKVANLLSNISLRASVPTA